jgi:UPF0755 protein
VKTLIYKFFAFGVLIGSLLTGWFLMEYNQFLGQPINVQGEPYYYQIKQGETLKQFSQNLYLAGVITRPKFLTWHGRLTRVASKIQVGEYAFKPGMTPREILHDISNGKTVQYSFTLIEGWNFRELMQELAKSEYLQHTLKGLNNEQIMEKLGYPDQHPEGRFLPDTYHFPRNTTDLDFLKRAYAATEKYLQEQWENRQPDLPYEEPYDALIMASIVEKETGLASERPAIAGVFVRRLNKSMRLQTDPTVIYGLGEKFDGNLRRRDLVRDTPYNTYRRNGLPPTPISMPGKDAIWAALHPEDGDALYFVARGDGSHEFTSNLRDHNRAVVKYQLGGKPRPFSSMPKVSNIK